VIPTTHGKEGRARHCGEARDHLEIGNQVRLFILFDRATTSDQSPFLKIDPRALTNPDDMDWAETEGIALVDILDILALQLAFKPVGSVRFGPDGSRGAGPPVTSIIAAAGAGPLRRLAGAFLVPGNECTLARRGVAFLIDIDPRENRDGGPGQLQRFVSQRFAAQGSPSATFKHSSSFCFMAGERVPSTWATVSAYTVTSTRQETTESQTKPVALPSGVLVSMNRQAGSLAIVRQILRDLGDDERADRPRVCVGLHNNGWPLFPAQSRRVREAHQDHIAPIHGFSGASSYSSMFSHPMCLPASQASA